MKNLNIFNKILTIILLSVVLYFNNSDLLSYFVFGILIVCFFNLKKYDLGIIYILILLFKVINIDFFVNSGKLYYLLMIVGIIVLIVESFTVIEKMYIFDKTLYKSHDMGLNKKHIYNLYYDKLYNKNYKNVEKYINKNNHKHLISQLSIKTKNELEDIYVLNRIRFYGLYNRKKIVFPDTWTRFDTLYLVFIVIISFVIIYFR